MENESTSIELNLSILSSEDNNASSVTPEKEPTKKCTTGQRINQIYHPEN